MLCCSKVICKAPFCNSILALYCTSSVMSNSTTMTTTMTKIHRKCRYPNLYVVKGYPSVVRTDFPDHLVPWDVEFDIYDPLTFTASFVLTAPWADPEIDENFRPKFNQLDGNVNRKSHEGTYLVKGNVSLNIRGRTGLRGRGVLGRWGPNHAADPIVTRWKRNENGGIIKDPNSGKGILQFVAIQRKDTGEWAIPGGMVDPGENVSATVRREFMEEAMDSTQSSSLKIEQMSKLVDDFFSRGVEVYKGYVDDPRNTDNSWMETVAFSFHDETGHEIGKFDLKAGDDAKALQWMDVSKKLNLYASHTDFLARVAELRGAHW